METARADPRTPEVKKVIVMALGAEPPKQQQGRSRRARSGRRAQLMRAAITPNVNPAMPLNRPAAPISAG